MNAGRGSKIARAGPDLAAVALLVLLSTSVLSDALFGGRVLLPSSLLRHQKPWSQAVSVPGEPPAWNPLLWDGIAQFYPWRQFAAEWTARGTFPLWNPHQFCGTPFFANSQSALFYPPNALFYLPGPLTTAERFAWLAIFHLCVAGIGAYAWLRVLGCGPAGAVLAGLAFMLSGFVVTWLELPTFLSVACWIPLLLLAIRRTLERRSLSWAALSGVAIGLMLLGGHLQIALYGLLAAGAYALFDALLLPGSSRPSPCRSASSASSAVNSPFPLLAAAIALAIGFTLAAPQVLPAVEMARFSHRAAPPSAEGYRAYVGYAVPAGHLITLFLPDFFGNPTRNQYWGAANYAEYAGYTGAATLLLALVGGLAAWRRTKAALFLAVIAMLSLWMATGSPLNALLYFGIPGFGQSGSPGRILVLFCLATAALAGLGLDALLTAARDLSVPVRRVAAWIGSAALLWGILLLIARQLTAAFLRGGAPFPFGRAWEASTPALSLALVLLATALVALGAGLAGLRTGKLSADLAGALIAGVPILVVAADLFSFASGFLLTSPAATVYPPTTLTQRLAADQSVLGAGRLLPLNSRWSLTEAPGAILPPNAGLAYRLMDVQGYDSLYLGRYKALANEIQGADTSPRENGNMLFLTNIASPLFPLLGVRQLLTDGAGAPLAPPTSEVGVFEGVRVTRDPRALPRAFVVPRWRTVPDAEALFALAELAASGPNALREEALISGAASASDAASFPEAGVGQAEILEESPNRVRIAVRSPAPGLLALTDNHYPGWVATVETGGQSTQARVLRADHTFRGIHVPAGASLVTLQFRPASLRIGLFLAALAVAIVGAVLAGGLTTRRVRSSL